MRHKYTKSLTMIPRISRSKFCPDRTGMIEVRPPQGDVWALNRKLKQRPRRRQRERQKSNWFKLAKRASRFFVHFFVIIARLQRKIPNFTVFGGRTQDNNFLFLFLNFDTVFQSSTPENIANIWRTKRNGISAINNGNWTELSAFDQKSYAWFQNRTSAQRLFDLKSQVWFQTKIARHSIQLPFYYIHFEIAEFSQY